MVCIRTVVLLAMAVAIPLSTSNPIPTGHGAIVAAGGLGGGLGAGLAAVAPLAALAFLPLLFQGRGHKTIVKTHHVHHKPYVFNLHYGGGHGGGSEGGYSGGYSGGYGGGDDFGSHGWY